MTTGARNPAGVASPGRAPVTSRTLRRDAWWAYPAATFTVLALFVAYATYAALANRDYYADPYLSPFYSPCMSTHCGAVPGSHGAPHLGWFGTWWIVIPAVIALVFPLGFRLTCYYYRKAYYRSFWASPPACAVAEPHKKYTGETRFPLILQNAHRYFFYLAIVVAGFLTYDVVLAFRNPAGQWGHMGLGTLILLVNIGLIWAYTVSCHSCRHIVGGRLRTFSRHPVRYRLWGWVSALNARHMLLAWLSLASVAVADLYVYLLASGAFTDPRFF